MQQNLPLFSGHRWAVLTALGLLGAVAPALAQSPVVQRASLSPAANARAAARASNVVIPFSQPIASATADNVRVFSPQRGGQLVRGGSATVSTSGSTITINPTTDLRPGETVFVTVPATVQSTTSVAATKYVYQLTAATTGGNGNLIGSTNLAVGNGPRAVAVGDVDGDGDLDLVAANTGANDISILLNTAGSGSFTAGTPVTLPISLPSSVALVDLDSDGDLDLLTANQIAGVARVVTRFNTGSGTFSGGVSYNIGSRCYDMVTGDIDGDGDIDVIATNFSSATISILKNDGVGNLSSTTMTVTGAPQGATLGDVDADGDLDLLMADNFSQVEVYTNGGTGSFTSTGTIAMGGAPFGVALGDLDGDGDLDVVSAITNTGKVGVALNGGTGTFGAATFVTVGTSPQQVKLGDVDADGDLDLFVANEGSGDVSVRLNSSSGTFSSGTYPTITAATSSAGLGLADLNRDGSLDFVTANATTSGTLSVRLNNPNPPINTSPTALTLSNTTLAENTGANIVVGALSATDADQGDYLRYSLVSGAGSTDNALVNLNNNNLRITSSPNYEAQSSYAVRVRVTDIADAFVEQAFTLTITDVNEPPTALNLSSTTLAENVPANSTVGTFTTTDPDAGTTFTYALVGGGGSTNNGAFNIAGNALRFNAVPDYEFRSSYAIRVRTTDPGGLTLDNLFTVTITNVNEIPTALTLSSSTLAENTGANATVGTLSTTDPDVGDTFTYTLVSGTGSTDNALVNISGNALRITANPDFETRSSYAIRVRTTDAGGLSFERAFTLTVTNVNDAPILTATTRTVAEDSPNGTLVGAVVTATDPDPGQTLTYAITAGNGAGKFAIDAITGQLTVAGALDFETTPSYALTVQVTDNGTPAQNASATVTVNVTDVNEAPTDIQLSNTTLAENVPANTLVGTFTRTDPGRPAPGAGTGTSQRAAFPYQLVAGIGATDNAAFTISNGTELHIVASPDFETKSSYSIRVRTTDGGGLSFEKVFTISITDVNEAPTALTLSNNTLDENVPANTLVGTFTGTDPGRPAPPTGGSPAQAPQAILLTYSLVGGAGSADNAAFTIANGNELLINASPDFETKSSYAIRVRVTDAGGLFFEQNFTVTITDLNEAPVSLTVSSPQAVPAGNYSDITVTNTGTATLNGAVVLNGPLVVQSGGTLNTNCQSLTGTGSFTLQAGATLRICNPQGISSTGATGAVQVAGARVFASDATYLYNGTAVQTTGPGLPATVRELEISNPAGVGLSQPTAVTHALRLTNGTLTTDGALTLLSTATRTAYAVHNGGLTSGNVTVQRYVGGPTAAGYRHLSSPVQATTVADLTTAGYTPLVNPAYNNLPYASPPAASFPNIFGFDETRGGTTPAYAGFATGYFSPATTGATLTSGRGWSVFMAGAKTPDFVGALTSGNVPMTLSATGTNTDPNNQKAGWHILGNPYAQPIDWDVAVVPAGMSGSISVFRTQGGNNGLYLTRANGLGSLPDGEIALGQAFFARATANNTVFNFTNALRVEANPATVARPTVDTRPMVRLTLQGTTPDAVADETLIYAEAGATLGEDNRFDGLRPGRNTGTVPTLASLIDGQEAAINSLPFESLTAGNTVVELTAALPLAGTYTLTTADVANLPAGTTVSLLDRKLNVAQPLTAGTTYQLTASAAGEVVAGRLALVFHADRVLGTGAVTVTPRALRIYPNPATATASVQVAGAAVGSSLTLFDATGRAVATVSADATGAATVPTRGLAGGVYVLRAADGRTARLVVE